VQSEEEGSFTAPVDLQQFFHRFSGASRTRKWKTRARRTRLPILSAYIRLGLLDWKMKYRASWLLEQPGNSIMLPLSLFLFFFGIIISFELSLIYANGIAFPILKSRQGKQSRMNQWNNDGLHPVF
jgi:hypothetical protein